MTMTTRFEVTMTDGWKVRVNAASDTEAKAKAEAMNRHGDKAAEVRECKDLNARQFWS
jgi:hypothetical protein